MALTLVADYPLQDNAASTTIVAAVGSNATAAANTSGKTADGPQGKYPRSLYFNGTSDRITTPAINLSSVNQVTVSAWCKTTAFNTTDDLMFESTSNVNSFTTGLHFNPNHSSTGGMALTVKGTTGYNQAIFARPSAAAWHHYLCVYDRTQATYEESLYIDGVSQSATSTPLTNNNTNNFGNDVWYLMSRGAASLFMEGWLCGFRIFSGVPSAAEVLEESQLISASGSMGIAF